MEQSVFPPRLTLLNKKSEYGSPAARTENGTLNIALLLEAQTPNLNPYINKAKLRK